MANSKWLLYGVGDTGTLIVEEAVRRGHSPLLAGRSAERLKPVAEQFGLEWVAVDLLDTTALSKVMARVDLVVHAAGPFMATSAPMVSASLAHKKHYLDISNEIPVFQALRTHDTEARQHGIALISGVGFGVVATDGFAQSVAAEVPDAKDLEIAIYSYTKGSSAGANKTRLELLAHGGWIRRHGQLVKAAMGSGAKRLQFPFGEQTILPIPSGDLEAAFYNTGIPNITVYGVFPMPPLLARTTLPIVQQVVANPTLRRLLERRVSAKPGSNGKTPLTADASQPGRSYVWARADNGRNKVVEAWQETGEGYAFTAAAAVRSVEEVFERRPSGVLTPSQAFGADFSLSIDGVKRYDAVKG